MKIYGNKQILNTLSSMIENDRLAQSFLIYGDAGLGKKTIAAYIASAITGASNPYAHPDIIFVEHSGKTSGFSVADLRKVCADAYVIPNTSDRKVYILSDCDNISTAAQDTLLKIIEEPPLNVHFIFTVTDKNTFLATILSRVISLGATECSFEECIEALQPDYSKEQIEEAFSVFHGNIGLMKGYLSDENVKSLVEKAKNITTSITDKDEYSLLSELNSLAGDKSSARAVFTMLDKIIRDACSIKVSSKSIIGCYKEGSEKLSGCFSLKKLQNIHIMLSDSVKELDTNVNLAIEMASICSGIINI